ncbi:MAG TPA: hypothetical protein VHS53_10140, partial [Mucilaginibacter sp.]|nr:hypothetical protein [Mucilaginibacter sp.]
MKRFIWMIGLLVCAEVELFAQSSADLVYRCTPCDNDCDTTVFYRPGFCPVCHMPLVRQTGAVSSDSLRERPGYDGHWEGVAATTDQELA